jgi:hypothetical protein
MVVEDSVILTPSPPQAQGSDVERSEIGERTKSNKSTANSHNKSKGVIAVICTVIIICTHLSAVYFMRSSFFLFCYHHLLSKHKPQFHQTTIRTDNPHHHHQRKQFHG